MLLAKITLKYKILISIDFLLYYAVWQGEYTSLKKKKCFYIESQYWEID